MTNKKSKEKKAINSQQVAVNRESMRKVKIYAASNYTTISAVITKAIDKLCDDEQIIMNDESKVAKAKTDEAYLPAGGIAGDTILNDIKKGAADE